jgi:hypothetical protein
MLVLKLREYGAETEVQCAAYDVVAEGVVYIKVRGEFSKMLTFVADPAHCTTYMLVTCTIPLKIGGNHLAPCLPTAPQKDCINAGATS